MKTNLIVDFDSTIISREIMEVMFELYLQGHARKAEIKAGINQITDMGMNGEIRFSQSLGSRLALIEVTPDLIQQTVSALKDSFSTSFLDNMKGLLGFNTYVISGGFSEMIIPLLEPHGFPLEKIYANRFISKNGKLSGVDPANPLAHDMGKVNVARSLNLKGRTVSVGDGFSDFQVKEQGLADHFLYYAEHVRREKVAALADKVVDDFSEVLGFLG